MTIGDREIELGGERLDYRLKRSERKTLGISVTPDGELIVTAPEDADQERIDEKLQKRAAWILDKLDLLSHLPPAIPERQFVPGETHLFLGRQYRLKVDRDQVGTERRDGRIVVGGVPADEPARIRNRLHRWYQREAIAVFSDRLSSCWKKTQTPSPRPKLKVSSMERRWGSYLRNSHSVMLNYQLVQAPIPLIDYVITHELCHIDHGDHGPAFLTGLNRMMPDWERRKVRLEAFFS